jgi:signal transduction histidine kinase
LVRNAIRASEQRREQILVELAVTHGGLDLAVSDAGAGMDEDTLERAATPFFSMTGGKGLGLFLAQST